MSQKIKSVTLKNPNITLYSDNLVSIDIDSSGFAAISHAGGTRVLVESQNIKNIEYEKTTILKRPDGSLIWNNQTIEEQTIVIIWQDYKYTTTCQGGTKHTCDLGNVFLYPQDKGLAEKKAAMLSKQLEIQYEIDRLNAEDSTLTHILVMSSDGKVSYATKPYIHSNYVAMSYNTADTILAEYSQDELKQYLGIII